MNKILRRAAAATTLALTGIFASVSGTAQGQEPAAEPMWPAVMIENNEFLVNAAASSACTADGHEVVSIASIKVSLSDIVKPGQKADAESLNIALVLAEMGDDKDLRAELEKYDFSKVDSEKITKIFNEEWTPLAKKYAADQYVNTAADLKKDILETLAKVAQKYEEQNGVTIALELTKGILSPTPTPGCLTTVKPAAPDFKP